ncbi:MAG: hypothetical protein ACK52I_06680 [Pseudomonadota bacterium]
MARKRATWSLILLACLLLGVLGWLGFAAPMPGSDQTSPSSAQQAPGGVAAMPLPGAADAIEREPRQPVAAEERWRVRVVRSADRSPIAGASVELRSGESATRFLELAPLIASFATDPDGVCLLPLTERSVVLRVQQPHFVMKCTDAFLPSAGDEVVLALLADVPFRVLVRDAVTGLGLAAARVSLQPAAFAPVVRRLGQTAAVVASAPASGTATGADGVAELHGVAPGFYDVAVTAPGMLAADLRAVEIPLSSDPLVVDLQPGHELAALVVDEGDEPKVGWEVQFRHPGRTWIVATDDHGIARSPGLPDGAAVTILVPRHDLDLAAMFAEAMLRPSKVEVQVPQANPIKIIVAKGLANPVRVVWPNGSSMDRLDLELLQEMTPSGHGLAQRVQVGAEVGAATLGATTTGMRGRFVVQAVGSVSGLWRSQPFFVTGTGQTVAMSEVVPRSGSLHGSVRDAVGGPASGVRVRLFATAADLGLLVPSFAPSSFAELRREVRTDAEGRFACDLLLPARYQVEALTDDGVAVGEVQVGEAAQLELTLAAPGRVLGTVQNLPAESAVRALITAASRAFWRTTLVDSDGRFVFGGLPPGNYAVALLPPASAAPLHAGGGRSAGRETSVQIVSGADVPCVLDMSTISRSLRVEVADAPAGAACVVQIERLFPFDRAGTEVWRLRQPVPRSGVVVGRDLDPAADYVVSLRREDGDALLAWVEVPRSASTVVLRPLPGSRVVVRGVPVSKELLLVPQSAGGVPARECHRRGERAPGGDEMRFEGVIPGSYRLVLASRADGSGVPIASMQLSADGGDRIVTWQPGQ